MTSTYHVFLERKYSHLLLSDHGNTFTTVVLYSGQWALDAGDTKSECRTTLGAGRNLHIFCKAATTNYILQMTKC
jgi:hypothetical protein